MTSALEIDQKLHGTLHKQKNHCLHVSRNTSTQRMTHTATAILHLKNNDARSKCLEDFDVIFIDPLTK